MAGIKSLKTNPQAALDGVWVEYPANSDGTIPRFKVARTTANNPEWKRVYDEVTRPYRRDMEKGLLDQDKARDVLVTVFCRALLKSWEHVQPNDDGKELEYGYENARELLMADEWQDLWDDLNLKTNDARLYREEQREAELKN
jgi:hypothetical protein